LKPFSTSLTAALTSAIVAMTSFQIGASFAKQPIPVVGSAGTTALRTLPLGIAVAIEFVGPLGVAVAASRRRLDYFWVALAAGGLLALLPISPAGRHLDPVGVACALAAGVGWALYIVFGQRAGAAHGGAASTWGMMIAALLVVPFGVADAGGALLSKSVLPYTLEMVALRRLSTKAFGTLMSFEPAMAAVAGVLILGERLTGGQWMAVSAIVIASIGTVSGER
jgi:inner membrane transporter RhtA